VYLAANRFGGAGLGAVRWRPSRCALAPRCVPAAVPTGLTPTAPLTRSTPSPPQRRAPGHRQRDPRQPARGLGGRRGPRQGLQVGAWGAVCLGGLDLGRQSRRRPHASGWGMGLIKYATPHIAADLPNRARPCTHIHKTHSTHTHTHTHTHTLTPSPRPQLHLPVRRGLPPRAAGRRHHGRLGPRRAAGHALGAAPASRKPAALRIACAVWGVGALNLLSCTAHTLYHSQTHSHTHSHTTRHTLKRAHACAQGERRWVVSDIIGAEDGLGVENLSGSGAIASTYWCGARLG
jgi:hypothetical protein